MEYKPEIEMWKDTLWLFYENTGKCFEELQGMQGSGRYEATNLLAMPEKVSDKYFSRAAAGSKFGRPRARVRKC